MQQRPRAEIPHRRRAGDRHHRHPLGECAGQTVERAQLAHDVRRHIRPRALEAGVAIGGIGCIQLIAGAYVVDFALENFVEESQDEIAGHSKEMIDAHLLEPDQEIFRHRHVRVRAHGRPPCEIPAADPRRAARKRCPVRVGTR